MQPAASPAARPRRGYRHLSTETATVKTSDLVSGYLPTTFGGTSVIIDGKAAYMDYVSATQLNVQVPADTASGSVTVTVTTASGTATAGVTMVPVQPGIFRSANYVLAVRPSDGVIINGTGAGISGYVMAAAARPGDVLSLYATWLGAVSPTIAPGLVFSGTYADTTSSPTVTVGGTTAVVSFAGLVGAGLYHINLTVPTSLATGSYPVIVTQSQASSRLQL